MLNDTFATRFWKKVAINRDGGCWGWDGAFDSKGYGQIWSGKRLLLAHRASWELHNGEIPTGLLVLHKCDNTACVRPDHLFLGTQMDNLTDCRNKGRMVVARGERAAHTKLTAEQVLQIRAMHVPGKVGFKRIAKLFGVKWQSVQAVILRKAWAHI